MNSPEYSFDKPDIPHRYLLICRDSSGKVVSSEPFVLKHQAVGIMRIKKQHECDGHTWEVVDG